MPTTTTAPAPENDDDDAVAEALADALVESAMTNPVHRLHLLQILGRAPEPGRISQEALAAALGISRQRVDKLERRALLKTQTALLAAASGLPEAARLIRNTNS